MITKEIERLRNSTIWSIEGWLSSWKEERSLRQWGALNFASWIVLSFANFSYLEIAILLVLGLITIVVELINTSIEAAVDLVSTETHPNAKKAKDTASAAVMVSAVIWGLVWIVFLGSKFV